MLPGILTPPCLQPKPGIRQADIWGRREGSWILHTENHRSRRKWCQPKWDKWALTVSAVNTIFQSAVLCGLPSGSAVKHPPAMQATRDMWVWSLDQEDPLEEEMATHSSILAWTIPWTEEPGGLQSMGSQRGKHGWLTEQDHDCSMYLVLPNKSPWNRDLSPWPSLFCPWIYKSAGLGAEN